MHEIHRGAKSWYLINRSTGTRAKTTNERTDEWQHGITWARLLRVFFATHWALTDGQRWTLTRCNASFKTLSDYCSWPVKAYSGSAASWFMLFVPSLCRKCPDISFVSLLAHVVSQLRVHGGTMCPCHVMSCPCHVMSSISSFSRKKIVAWLRF